MSLELLRENAPLISALAGVGSFFIWFIYAILFYSEFRYRRSPHLFIHAAGDGGANTECLIINLSSEPVHILCSLASQDNVAVQIQDPAEQDLPIKVRSKQGPLDAGESLSLGRFESIAQALGIGTRDSDKREQHLEIRVAAIHGLKDQPIGASRGFLYNTASSHVIANMAYTQQKRSRRGSREVKKWMEQCHSYRGTERSE